MYGTWMRDMPCHSQRGLQRALMRRFPLEWHSNCGGQPRSAVNEVATLVTKVCCLANTRIHI